MPNLTVVTVVEKKKTGDFYAAKIVSNACFAVLNFIVHTGPSLSVSLNFIKLSINLVSNYLHLHEPIGES